VYRGTLRTATLQTMGLDLDAMLEDLGKAPEGSVFVLHTVAHNPSGVDPTEEQWKKIADLCEAKKAIPIFDTAYQVAPVARLPPLPTQRPVRRRHYKRAIARAALSPWRRCCACHPMSARGASRAAGGAALSLCVVAVGLGKRR